MRINARLLLIMTLFALLLLGVSGVIYQKSYNALRHRVIDNAMNMAHGITDSLHDQLNLIKEDLLLFAVTAKLEGDNDEMCSARVPSRELLDKRFIGFFETEYGYKLYIGVAVYGVDGKLLSSTEGYPSELKNRLGWGKAIEDGVSFRDIMMPNGEHLVSVAVPLHDELGEAWGVIQALTTMSALLRETRLPLAELNVRRIDFSTKSGELLYSTALHKSGQKISVPYDLLHEHSAFRDVTKGGVEELVIVQGHDHSKRGDFSWLLIVHLDYQKVFGDVLVLRWWIVGSILLIICMGTLFLLYITRNITKPLTAITDATRHFGAGNFSERIRGRFFAEFKTLTDSFNMMAANIEKSQERLESVVDVRTQGLQQANDLLTREVQERRAVQAALVESETQLRDAHELAGLGYWTWDVNTGDVTWTEEIYKIFQVNPEEFTPQIDSILEMSPWPEDNRRDKELIEKALRDRGKGEYEQRFLRPDGSTGYYHSTFKGKYDGDGTLVSIEGTVFDITERKKAEIASQEANAILQAAMDCSPAGIAIADVPDGALRYVNKAGLGIRDGSKESVVNGVILSDYVDKWQLYYLDGRPMETEEVPLARAIMFGETNNRQLIIRRPDQEDRIVWAHAAPVVTEEGETIAAVVVFPDITDIKRAEEAIRQSESRLQLAAESGGLGLWEWDLVEGVATVNDYWLTLKGITRKEYDSSVEGWINGIHPDDKDRVTAQLEKHYSGETDSFETEYRYMRRGQGWYWEHASGKVLERGDDGTPLRMLGSHQDITNRKHMEIRLAMAQKLESVGQLAAGIAHEINTPLQYIGGNLKFLDTSIPELEQANMDCLKIIEECGLPEGLGSDSKASEIVDLFEDMKSAIIDSVEGVGRISEIVLAMKKFSHPEVESIKGVDLNEAIKNMVVIAKNEWKYVADVELYQNEDIPLVYCNPGEISQVLLNLLVNAAHAVGQKFGGSSEKGAIAITTELIGNEVILTVKDNGIGIPPELQNRIFDPFFTTKEVGQGTGQGLSIAYSIIEKLGGSIELESEENVGSTFALRFPAPDDECNE